MKRFGKKFWISVGIACACAVAITVTLCVVLIKPETALSHVVIEPGNPQVSRDELEVRLVREKLVTVTLKSDGYILPHTDDTRIEFSKSQANVFGIENDTLIGPGCYFESHMAISNVKSASFEYWLEIKPVGGDNLLAEQLKLTVSSDEGEIVDRMLGEGLSTAPIATVADNCVSRFTVRLTYTDLPDNDATQNSTLAFDLVVHARLI